MAHANTKTTAACAGLACVLSCVAWPAYPVIMYHLYSALSHYSLLACNPFSDHCTYCGWCVGSHSPAALSFGSSLAYPPRPPIRQSACPFASRPAMSGAQNAVLTKSGKLRRTGSPSPSDMSTRAPSTIGPQPSAFNPQFDALRRYLGGNRMSQAKYESIFGAVSADSPFGADIWDGLLTYFLPGYVQNFGRKFLWCGDCRHYLPWLGAYDMPTKLSKSVSRMPILTDDSRPSGALYPAVFLLTPMQDNYLKSIVGDGADPSVIVGHGIVNSMSGSTDVGMSEPGEESDVESDVDIGVISSHNMGDVYMVRLKIMIGGSSPWPVHMDHIHLYTPFLPSRL